MCLNDKIEINKVPSLYHDPHLILILCSMTDITHLKVLIKHK